MKNLINYLSVSQKILIPTALLIFIIFLTTTFIVYKTISSKIESEMIESLNNYVKSMNDRISNIDYITKNQAEKFMSIFLNLVKDIGIAANNQICDRFTEMTKGNVATIFKKEKNDFIRIATSLKKEDGTRAVGTKLDINHPAYPLLLQGKSYTGKAELFGRDYMTVYIPIKNNNSIIGTYFIGFDITDIITDLKNSIRNIKIGESGYFYILDATEKNKGMFIVHPSLEGTNVLKSQNENEKKIISQIIEKKNGVIRYFWKNPGEKHEREKIAIFSYNPNWNWIIVASLYKEDILDIIIEIRNYMLIAGIIGSIVLSLIILIIIKITLRPLSNITEALKSMGDLTIKIQKKSNDEFGKLTDQFNHYITTLRDIIHELSKKAIEIQNSSEILTSSGLKLSNSNSHLTLNIKEISKETEDTAKNVNEIYQSIEQIKASSDDTKQITQTLVQEIQHNVESIKELSNNILKASLDVNSLNETSKIIENILNLIKGITNQINLVALNAAIQATKAGEHGKGFVVVSEEIKSLAEKTQKATTEVATIIQSIQDKITKVIEEMNLVQVETQQKANVIANTQKKIETISDKITHISNQIYLLTSASHQISSTIAELEKQIKEIIKIQEDNENIAKSISNNTQQLNLVSSALLEIVKKFKV